MPETPTQYSRPAVEKLGDRFGRQLGGLVFALLVEALVIAVVVSLGVIDRNRREDERLVSIALRESARKTQNQPTKAKEQAKPLQQTRATPRNRPRPQAIQPPAALPSPAFIPLPKDAPSFDIARLPQAPAAPPKRMFGPADSGSPGDSKQVGLAPNGQPMFGAQWYREPSDDELRGYLSTAYPGWALIACRTVADFRVEDCVPLDEYPSGSQMLRAVLAATWQFRVRPPRIGGVSQVGAWVRIRIEYDLRRN